MKIPTPRSLIRSARPLGTPASRASRKGKGGFMLEKQLNFVFIYSN